MTIANRSLSPSDPIATSRRGFLVSSALAVAALALGCTREGVAGTSPKPKGVPGKVSLVEFSNGGERLKTVLVAKVVKSDDAWRRQLSPASYNVTRRAGTERPFSGKYANQHARG
ncbi:MAG: peptide-methionine (R)-S-oxide reductase, partial [Lysobacter sp.]